MDGAPDLDVAILLARRVSSLSGVKWGSGDKRDGGVRCSGLSSGVGGSSLFRACMGEGEEE